MAQGPSPSCCGLAWGTTGRGRGSLRLSALGLMPSWVVGMKSRVPPPLPAPGEGGGEGAASSSGRPEPPRARSTHGFWFS